MANFLGHWLHVHRSKSLAKAAKDGNLNAVSRLLDKGTDINTKDESGMTPLMHAAAETRLEVVELLLERGAHVTEKNNVGQTALEYALLKLTSVQEIAKDFSQKLSQFGVDNAKKIEGEQALSKLQGIFGKHVVVQSYIVELLQLRQAQETNKQSLSAEDTKPQDTSLQQEIADALHFVCDMPKTLTSDEARATLEELKVNDASKLAATTAYVFVKLLKQKYSDKNAFLLIATPILKGLNENIDLAKQNWYTLVKEFSMSSKDAEIRNIASDLLRGMVTPSGTNNIDAVIINEQKAKRKLIFKPVVCLKCGSHFKTKDSPFFEHVGDEIRTDDTGGSFLGMGFICNACGENHNYLLYNGEFTLERTSVPRGFTGSTKRIYKSS